MLLRVLIYFRVRMSVCLRVWKCMLWYICIILYACSCVRCVSVRIRSFANFLNMCVYAVCPFHCIFCIACMYAYFRKIAHIGQSTCPVCIWRFTPSTRPLLTLVPVCWPIRLDSYRRVAVTDIVYHAKNDTLENFRFRSHLLGALRKEKEKKKNFSECESRVDWLLL